MQLQEIQQLNFNTIKDNLCIVAAGHPMSSIGTEMQSMVEGFEARAIYHLLLDLNTSAFFTNLQRSAHARRFFLRKSREQASDDVIFTALSRTGALLDCIAGGNWPLALEIENLSQQDWAPAGEYEETYCYYKLLHAHVAATLRRSESGAAQEWRRRLETVVAGIPRPALDVARLEICTTFLASDETAFWDDFDALVAISGEGAAAVPLADGRVFEFPWLAADRYISIELLAWMALARSRGFRPPQREYTRCPSAAWISGAIDPAPDVFLDLEAQFSL